jgi:CRP/FNR family transcriptional regulator, nitrogen fixation regulation protein
MVWREYAMQTCTATVPIAATGPARQVSKAGPDINTIAGSMDLMGARIGYGRNVEIFGEGEPADYLYKVVSGAVRSCKILEDGRRQVAAFHMPGEIFGLDIGESHRFSAEAINDCVVVVVKRSTIFALAARDSDIARQLWIMTALDLQRVQDHMLVLGCMNARERVGRFLLDIAKRDVRSNEIQLPMARQDIADYLGLTIETVSRTITQLENDAAIGLPSSRRIVLRNRAALSELNA